LEAWTALTRRLLPTPAGLSRFAIPLARAVRAGRLASLPNLLLRCARVAPESVDRERGGTKQHPLLDGIFLHAPVLNGCFELTIFVNTHLETCLRRGLARNQERALDLHDLEALYREKYIPGFELYREEVAPQERASIVVEMAGSTQRSLDET
jgi:hypothetical protein